MTPVAEMAEEAQPGVRRWTVDEVLKLAPDGSSAGAARRGARAGGWRRGRGALGAGAAGLGRGLSAWGRRGRAWPRHQPFSFWDAAAARLVDAQMPGLADRVRALPARLHAGVDWADWLLAE